VLQEISGRIEATAPQGAVVPNTTTASPVTRGADR
jgi:hypothetical protein